ncbi:MAG TPA: DUF2948 family protein, partial [Alphaproteobacteria bacterium]|nr:DUF2948 family protein [Alphaproteobacteria bacterium]
DLADGDGLLPLLALRAEPAEGENVGLRLEFAGGGTIRLVAEAIDCHLSDLGQGWPTPNRPDHDLGDA